MKARYTPSNQGGSSVKNILAALSLTALVFAVLPFLQFAEAINSPGTVPAPIIVSDPPPAPIPEEPLKEEEPKEKPEEPEIEKPLPKITLKELEMFVEGGPNSGGIAVDIGENYSEFIDTDLPIDIVDLDKKPKSLFQIKPNYPYSLKQLRIEGSAVIEWIINPDGRVRSAKVISSSHPEFAKSAMDAILRSKWRPGEKDGRLVATRVQQEIKFSL